MTHFVLSVHFNPLSSRPVGSYMHLNFRPYCYNDLVHFCLRKETCILDPFKIILKCKVLH